MHQMGCVMLTSMISYRHKTSLRHLSSVQVVDHNQHYTAPRGQQFGVGHTNKRDDLDSKHHGTLLCPKRGSVRAGPTRSALEIQAQAFHGHSYPNEQLVMSREHTCYIWLNHMCDNNVITAVSLQDPGRWASRRIQMRIPFICVRWPFMIRFTGDRVKTCSNKFWHDCLPAFFYNLNTISYHLYFLLIGRTLCKGSATIAYLCKEKHHNRTRAFDWSY
jgi:hypothetical protein